MPKLVYARAPIDSSEESNIRKLARSQHAPADWITRARVIARSWDGLRATQIAAELGCHPQTVREHIARFNAEGCDGLRNRSGGGRKPRLTEDECSQIVALVAMTPADLLANIGHGALVQADRQQPAHWTLDALAAAAQASGIQVSRSQVRRIMMREGLHWRPRLS